MRRRRTGRGLPWVAVALAAGIAVTGCSPAAEAAGAPGASGAAGAGAPVTTAPGVSTGPGQSAPGPLAPEAGTTTAPVSPPPAPSAPSAPAEVAPTAAASSALRQGDHGPAVLALQQRLSGLGYWLGTPDSSYGLLTQQAVLALQGAADLPRDGVAGPAVQAALAAGTRPRATTTSGRATEVDRERGLLLFVSDGEAEVVLHTSTGTFERYTHGGRTHLADTPEGTFRVTWAQDGWREGDLGRLYRPRYFHPDGIAVHGYGSVPAQPASHGCARVTLAAMDMIWARDLMPPGSTVVVR